MSVFPRISSLVWLIAPVCACGLVVWSSQGRLQRVEYVSGLAGRAGPVDVIDAASPTGYANGQRELIVPERNETSFGWLAQTLRNELLFDSRVRSINYNIDCVAGTIYLMGVAQNQAELQRVIDHARDISYVRNAGKEAWGVLMMVLGLLAFWCGSRPRRRGRLAGRG